MAQERTTKSPEFIAPRKIEVIKPRTLQRQEVKFLHQRDYICEVKYNGVRSVAVIDQNRVKILTIGQDNRTYRDVSSNLPELKNAFDQLGESHALTILDGELISGEGKTNEERKIVNARLVSQKPFDPTVYPIGFKPFDILYLDGVNIRTKQLIDRKELLNDLFPGEFIRRFGIKPVEVRKRDFELFIYQAAVNNFEGVIFKRRDGLYVPSRTRWLKHKFTEKELAQARTNSFT